MYRNDILWLDVQIPPLETLKTGNININIWPRYRFSLGGYFFQTHPVKYKITTSSIIHEPQRIFIIQMDNSYTIRKYVKRPTNVPIFIKLLNI